MTGVPTRTRTVAVERSLRITVTILSAGVFPCLWAWPIEATVWQNTYEKDGEAFESFSVTIEKSYRNGEEWKKTTSFKPADLPKVKLLADKVYAHLVLDGHESAEG